MNYDKRDFTKEEIEQAVKESKSYAELARKLGYSDKTGHYTADVKKWIKKYNCDVSHLTEQKYNTLNYDDLFKNKAITGSSLMKFLLEKEKRERKCERCGNSEWNGLPIPLQIHHIDGNHYNNRIDNLQILCLNCHAQTDNFGNKNNRKINRISDEQIIKAIETSYNVSEVLRKIKISDCKLSRDRIKQIIFNGHPLLKKEKTIKSKKEVSKFQKFREEEFKKRKEYFLNNKIDFTKYGWQAKVEKDLGLSHTQIRRWLKKYMPELNVYRRKA